MSEQRQSRGEYKSPEQQIKEFVAAIYERDDCIEIRKLGREEPGMKKPVEKEWYLASELHKEFGRLKVANTGNRKYEIHVGVNPRPDYGVSGDKNIKCFRCLFADFDFDKETDYLKFVRDLLAQHGLPAPTVIVLSGHGVHVYWRLKEPLELGKWREMQERLIAALGCDTAVKNPERLLRLPGYWNWKKKGGF